MHPHVLNLCLSFNRHKCLKRVIRCFLDQDYVGDQTLLIYNTGEPIKERDIPLPENKHMIIINSQKDFSTGEVYNCVGSKYNDVMELLDNMDGLLTSPIDIITHFDDDDVFLPWFNRLGVEGFAQAKVDGYEAYKTYWSYFRDQAGMHIESNNFEPSIFLNYHWLRKHSYLPTNVTFHDGWYKPLLEEGKLFVDRKQKPLFIYDWHPELKVYKMSGGADTEENYQGSVEFSQDFCEGTLTPNESNEKWYKMIEDIV